VHLPFHTLEPDALRLVRRNDGSRRSRRQRRLELQ
jgi:hypothetical protein